MVTRIRLYLFEIEYHNGHEDTNLNDHQIDYESSEFVQKEKYNKNMNCCGIISLYLHIPVTALEQRLESSSLSHKMIKLRYFSTNLHC